MKKLVLIALMAVLASCKKDDIEVIKPTKIEYWYEEEFRLQKNTGPYGQGVTIAWGFTGKTGFYSNLAKDQGKIISKGCEPTTERGFTERCTRWVIVAKFL